MTLSQDYVRTAKAKGVTPWKVIFKHALRNALIPVITYVGPMTAYILTGSLVVNYYLQLGGLGSKVCYKYHKQRLSNDYGYNNVFGNTDGYHESSQ